MIIYVMFKLFHLYHITNKKVQSILERFYGHITLSFRGLEEKILNVAEKFERTYNDGYTKWYVFFFREGLRSLFKKIKFAA